MGSGKCDQSFSTACENQIPNNIEKESFLF